MERDLLEEYYFEELKISLAVLSMSGEKQFEVTGYGCVGEEILIDFEKFYTSVREDYISEGVLNDSQIGLLDGYSDYIASFDEIEDEDFFWDKEIVCSHEKWAELRVKTNELLRALFDEKYDIKITVEIKEVNGHRLERVVRKLIVVT